jgi:hypothetical protein
MSGKRHRACSVIEICALAILMAGLLAMLPCRGVAAAVEPGPDTEAAQEKRVRKLVKLFEDSTKAYAERAKMLDASALKSVMRQWVSFTEACRRATPSQKKALLRVVHRYVETVVTDVEKRVDPKCGLEPGRRISLMPGRRPADIPGDVIRWQMSYQSAMYQCLIYLTCIGVPEGLKTAELIRAAPEHVEPAGDPFYAPIRSEAGQVAARFNAMNTMEDVRKLGTPEARLERLRDLADTPDSRLTYALRVLLVEELVKHGADAVPSLIKIRADGALAELGKLAVGPVIQLLKSDDPQLVKFATSVLWKNPDPMALEPLLDLFLSEKPGKGSTALIRYGDEACERLLARLKKLKPEVSRRWVTAAHFLANLKYVDAIPVLERVQTEDMAPDDALFDSGKRIAASLDSLKMEALRLHMKKATDEK